MLLQSSVGKRAHSGERKIFIVSAISKMALLNKWHKVSERKPKALEMARIDFIGCKTA